MMRNKNSIKHDNQASEKRHKTKRDNNRKKKILIVHPIFMWGGSEQVLLSMIKSLHKSYDLHILTGKSLKKNNKKIYRRYNVDLSEYYFNEIINGGFFSRFPYLLKQIQQRKVYEIDSNFDLVVSSSGTLKSSQKTVEYIHYPNKESGTRRKRRFKTIKKVIQKLILSNAPKRISQSIIITNSRWTRDNIKDQQRGNKMIVIYPPVTTLTTEVENKNEYNLVALSRITPEKYIESTIYSFNVLNAKHPKLTLNIIGSTNNCDRHYIKHIKELCKYNQNITLLFDVSESRKESLLSEATYGLHSMPKEHFGIAIVEMMRFGTIPFVPNNGGQVEIVNNEQLVYSSRNDLQQKFDKIFMNKIIRNEVSTQCRERSHIYSEERFNKEFTLLTSKALGQ